MNIRIEKIDITNTEVIDFLARQNLALYLELNPKTKKLYDSNYKELIGNTFITEYKKTVKAGIIYASYINDAIIGAGYINKDNYLDSLFVSEEYRNMGIGSSILEKLIDDCIKLGVIRVDANLDAISLYERFNFERVEGALSKTSVPMELKERKNGK